MKNIIQILALNLLFSACSTNSDKPAEKLPKKLADSSSQSPTEATDSLLAKNRLIAQHFYEDVVNKHDPAMIDSYATADYVEHQYDTHFEGNLKGTKKAFLHYFTAFPDMHVKVNFMMADGDLVTAQITTSGTNTGPIYGRPGTGKKFEINGVDIVRFKNGKVAEHWGYTEEGKLLTQLGVIRPLIKEGRKEQKEMSKLQKGRPLPIAEKANSN